MAPFFYPCYDAVNMGVCFKVRDYIYWQAGRHYGRQYALRKQGNALVN